MRYRETAWTQMVCLVMALKPTDINFIDPKRARVIHSRINVLFNELICGVEKEPSDEDTKHYVKFDYLNIVANR